MKLTDRAGTSSKLLKNASPTGPQAMMGCVIAREVFAVGESGELRPIPDATWPVGAGEAETALGTMPGDRPFYMGGVDVLLGGRVFSDAPVRTMDVEIEVGRTFRRRIRVFGDRTWLRGASQGATPTLVPSEPRELLSMALSYERAFGGTAETPSGPSPYTQNPAGRGFFADSRAAEGQPLPNLEDPADLVTTWSDRPFPVGLGYYPLLGALRALAAVDHPAAAEARAKLGLATSERPPSPPDALDTMTAEQLSPILFNQGHPGMVIEAAKAPKAGDVVRVSHGRRGGGDLVFTLPDRPLHVHVQLGDREHVVPLHLDQIGIECGEDRVMLSQRTVFEYDSVKGEPREATLYRGRLPATIPPEYRRVAQAGWDRDWWDR
jgi:hypothetical protein